MANEAQPLSSNTQEVNQGSTSQNPGGSPLSTDQLREYSKKWSLAGDSGLLLYLHDFSQRIISKTTEIDRLVENLKSSTQGSSAKVHNTFNDFLMLSSNQFIENRVYDEEVSEEQSQKEVEEKPERTREEQEAEILPRYTKAVEFGLSVLDDAFITVEVKPQDEDSEDEDDVELKVSVADPIIELKDVYAHRPLPHLIGTAEFLHDETLGLTEVVSDDEGGDQGNKDDEEKSDGEQSSGVEPNDSEEEEVQSTSEFTSSDDEDVGKAKTLKTKSKKSFIDESDGDSDGDLFSEKKAVVKTSISDSESERSENDSGESGAENSKEESEEEDDKPVQNNFQAELASKLGLGKQVSSKLSAETQSVDSLDTESQKQDTVSVASRKADDVKSIVSVKSTQSKTKKRTSSRTASTTDKKKGHTISKNKTEKKQAAEEDEDLFGPQKTDDFFVEHDDGPFAKKSGGLFGASGGNSLFDDQDDDEEGDLFSENKPTKSNDDISSRRTDTQTEENKESTITEKTKERTRTTSSGKKLPAGAVSIFGDSDALFGGPLSKKGASSVTKPPKEVKGLFDDNDEDDMFGKASQQSSHLNVKSSESSRKRTLKLEDDLGDTLFQEKKTEVRTLAPNDAAKSERTATKPSGVDLFGEEKEQDDLFGFVGKGATSSGAKDSPSTAVVEKKKSNIISLFDDDGEDDDANEDEDIFAGLSTVNVKKSKSEEKTMQKSTTNKVASLFEDDDDDLFSAATITQSESTSSIKQLPSTKPSTKQQAATTRPANSKSIFSDSCLFGEEEDLFASDRPVKENLSKKPQEVVQTHKVVPSPSTDSVSKKVAPPGPFGDDSDDDDLFGNDKTKTTQNNTKIQNKTKEPQTKPVTRSPDPFGVSSEDDLFETSTTPANKASVQNKEQAGGNEKKTFTKPSANKKIDLFSDSDDDLFSVPKSNPKLNPVKTNTTDQKAEENNVESTDNNSNTNDNLQAASEIIKETDEADAPVKPKKPIGGVSMFGGIDPFAAKKGLKSTGNTSGLFGNDDDEEKNDMFSTTKNLADRKPKPVAPKKEIPPKIEVSSDPLSALFGEENALTNNTTSKVAGKQSEIGNTSAKTSPVVPSVAATLPAVVDHERPATKKSIDKLQASLNFNPAALLPGAAPPKKETPTSTASFDEPVQAKTLANDAHKARVKGQARRRPPTRNGRQIVSSDMFGESSPQVNDVDMVDTLPKDLTKQEIAPKSAIFERSAKDGKSNINIFQDDDDDFFSVPSNKTDIAQIGQPKKISQQEAGEAKSSLFSGEVNADEDDLFGAPIKYNAKNSMEVTDDNKCPEPKDHLVSALLSTPLKRRNENVMDNLFEPPQKSAGADKLSFVESNEGSKTPLSITDSSTRVIKNVFGDDSDDDIFSDKKKSKSSDLAGNTVPPVSKNEEKKDISFDSKSSKRQVNTDDLFGSNASGQQPTDQQPTDVDRPPPQGSKEVLFDSLKALNTDHDIFDNDVDDIFSSKKETVNTTGAVNKTTKDDVVEEGDDIFSPKQTRKKETSKSKQKVHKKQTDDDLFGDSGSIFDDLPSSSKVKKKSKKKSSASGDIFATSTTDDIFAPKKEKSKKKIEKSGKESKVTVSEEKTDIFDDPLNAFAGK